MTLSEQLREIAVKNNVCDKFLSVWTGDETIEELIDKYWKGMDFCIEKNFPPVNFIREKMKGLIEPFGIFIDESFDVRSIKRLALYENAKGTARFGDFTVGDIYMFDGSTLNLFVGENAFVYISMHPGSVLNIRSKFKSSKIGISYFGGMITGDTYNVNIYHKNNK